MNLTGLIDRAIFIGTAITYLRFLKAATVHDWEKTIDYGLDGVFIIFILPWLLNRFGWYQLEEKEDK